MTRASRGRNAPALGVSLGRLAELGIEIKPALDRQTVVGLGGLDDITDRAVWVICLGDGHPVVATRHG